MYRTFTIDKELSDGIPTIKSPTPPREKCETEKGQLIGVCLFYEFIFNLVPLTICFLSFSRC
jgi:hypothetical protein